MEKEGLKNKLKEFKEYYKKYAPVILSTPLIIPLPLYNKGMMLRLLSSSEELHAVYKRYKRKVLSNNWLKFHKEPMRRKGI